MRTSQRQRILFCSGTFVILLGLVAGVSLARRPSGASTAHATDPRRALADGQQFIAAYGKLALSFESNQGQLDRSVQFIAHGPRQAILLTSTQAILELPSGDGSAKSSNSALPSFVGSLSPVIPNLSAPEIAGPGPAARYADPRIIRMTLVGARRDVQGIGIEKLPGTTNYFLGNDRKNWKTNIGTYSKVKYEKVYPGIDLIYYGNQAQLEEDFVVSPGSDPNAIKLDFQGVQKVRIDESTGDLVLSGDRKAEEVRLRKPVIYQQASENSAAKGNGGKQFVDGRYVIDPQGRAGFEIAQYDLSRPLIIDPVLSYFTYLGGLLPDFALRVAVDSSGSAYVTGATVSPNFPVTTGALRSTLLMSVCGQGSFFPGGGIHFPCPDAFVTKLNPTGTAAVYSTYFGGTRSDIGFGVAVDSSGNAYVTGQTESPDFPTTSGAFQGSSVLHLGKAFVTKLNPTGSQILYSTYLGGTSGTVSNGDQFNDSWATAVAVDNSGNAYVSGYTRSNSFPTTAGVIQPNPSDVTFVTTSNFPPPKQPCPNLGITFLSSTSIRFYYRCSDSFVAKFNTTLSGASSLVYSTYLGGNNYDAASGIAIDSSGNAYVVGMTLSSTFPTANAFQTAFGGGQCGANRGGSQLLWNHICAEAFITKLNSTATAFVFSTYLGGSADNVATGVAVDSSGNAYVTGFTNSANFPTSAGVAQSSHSAASCFFGATVFLECPDAFVAKFSSTGSRLYSTYLGGTGADLGLNVAADSQGNAYVTGTTNSTNFPTSIPFQANLGSGTCTFRGPASVPFSFTCPDVFVSKLDPTGATLLFSSYLGGNNADIGTGIAVDTSNNIYLTGATMSTGLATAGVFQSSPPGMGDAFVAKIGSVSDFSIGAASGGSLSATVAAGNPAAYNLQVNPSGGFTGAVSLTCTGAPALTTCNPPTAAVTVSATSSVPFTVNVTTTKSTFVLPGKMRELFPYIPESRTTMNFFLLLVALAICRMALNGRTKSGRAYVHAAILLIGMATLLTACGSGGGGSGGGTPGTTPGTYTLTITGTSGGLSHIVNLTLTVN